MNKHVLDQLTLTQTLSIPFLSPPASGPGVCAQSNDVENPITACRQAKTKEGQTIYYKVNECVGGWGDGLLSCVFYREGGSSRLLTIRFVVFVGGLMCCRVYEEGGASSLRRF